MNRRFVVLALILLTFMPMGCQDETLTTSGSLVSRPTGTHYLLPASSDGRLPAQQPDRFIAERDSLMVTTPASQLQSVWGSTVAFCATIQCEVLSSSLTTQTSESLPSANVSMRIAPEELQNLIRQVQQLAKIVQHTTDRDDKTTQVIDIDARITNLTAFRDNLRAMLARPNVTVANLIQINQQLTDTQSELDAETTQRKVLANQTEKVAVDVSFGVERNARSGVLTTIGGALGYVGNILGESLAALVTVILFLIPWAILFCFVVWLVIKARRRTRRIIPPPSPVST